MNVLASYCGPIVAVGGGRWPVAGGVALSSDKSSAVREHVAIFRPTTARVTRPPAPHRRNRHATTSRSPAVTVRNVCVLLVAGGASFSPTCASPIAVRLQAC